MSETQPQTNSPLFYSRPEPLNRAQHEDLGLVRSAHPYGFAAKTNAVPINSSEFNYAQKCYPIVFSPSSPHHALAVLGMSSDENLFVDERGAWSNEHYIPAYVRRFPFIMAPSPEDNDRFLLCVETETDLVSDSPDMPFFKDGEMTELAQNALDFCKEFHEQAMGTRLFLEALEEFELLKQHDLTMKGADGADQKLGTFYGVDEDKLNNFDDQKFLELRRRKILPLIYMHLASLSNWSRLLTYRSRLKSPASSGDMRH